MVKLRSRRRLLRSVGWLPCWPEYAIVYNRDPHANSPSCSLRRTSRSFDNGHLGETMLSSRAAGLPPFRITRIAAAPLFGESPKGGWSAEIRPEDSIHALIAVHTDRRHHRLWQRVHRRAAGRRRRSRCSSRSIVGENALDAGARDREAAPEHVLDGPRRHADAHDQRHRHRAVGHSRQGHRAVGRPAARRRLSRSACSPIARC